MRVEVHVATMTGEEAPLLRELFWRSEPPCEELPGPWQKDVCQEMPGSKEMTSHEVAASCGVARRRKELIGEL